MIESITAIILAAAGGLGYVAVKFSDLYLCGTAIITSTISLVVVAYIWGIDRGLHLGGTEMAGGASSQFWSFGMTPINITTAAVLFSLYTWMLHIIALRSSEPPTKKR